MQAEGSQGVAAERVGAAAASLEKAAQQAAQQQQELSEGDAGEGKRDKPGDQPAQQPDQLDIPTGEEFRTPDAYRKALLDGMEGEVPEEYRALKKRYYEELVAQ
jgi:hypothetical protein